MYVPRIAEIKAQQLLQSFKALVITGPRQSGKTTMSRHCFPNYPYASLENPAIRSFALTDPEGFLNQFPGGAILDEIQRVPALLSYLQQKLDDSFGKFVLTGSNNLLLIEQITQTLAGRAAYIELLPFSLAECEVAKDNHSAAIDSLLWEGSYPAVQAGAIPPEDWYNAYLRTYVERDVRQIRNVGDLLRFERFLALCAARTAQQLNYANLATETGIDLKTAQAWMGILSASYVTFLLPPYYRNFSKRVTKSPKLYFCDVGLAAHLLGIRSPEDLVLHPFRGALFENFIVLELLKNRYHQGQKSNLFYWKDSACEIDVLIERANALQPIEIKSGQTITPEYFKSIQYWGKISGQPGGTVLYGGESPQLRSDGISVLSWRKVKDFL